jgi:uncharacterized protein (TIGR02444 family)
VSELWSWALESYARPGVAEACLRLQDEHGQNAPLLLWTLWSLENGRGPDLAAGAELARTWEALAVAPLRAVRRALKAPAPGLNDAAREAVRAQVKAVELEAERRLLLALAALPPCRASERAWAEQLAEASAAWTAPLPPSAFDDLLRALNSPAA